VPLTCPRPPVSSRCQPQTVGQISALDGTRHPPPSSIGLARNARLSSPPLTLPGGAVRAGARGRRHLDADSTPAPKVTVSTVLRRTTGSDLTGCLVFARRYTISTGH
jgi:hypothetical protein